MASETPLDGTEDVSLPICCLVADRSAIFSLGLEAALASDHVRIVGRAGSPDEVRGFVARGTVDVVLSCFEPPDDSISVAAAAGPCPVLVLSSHLTDDFLIAAVRAGARGALAKDASREELVAAVNRVASGDTALPNDWPEVLAKALEAERQRQPNTVLTRREEQVMQRVAEGYSNKQLARDLGIAEQTVKNHLRHIMAKLGLSSRVQLARWALTPSGDRRHDSHADD